MITVFPHGAVARVWHQNALPARLQKHGAIMVVTGRYRDPRLEISQVSHVIIKMRAAASPAGGWQAMNTAAESVEAGGSCWLSFSCQAHTNLFIKDILPHTGIILISDSSVKNGD